MPPYPKSKQTGNLKITISEFKAIKYKESQLQKECEEWLESEKIVYLRIPEEVTRLCSPQSKVTQHVKNSISKYLKGWPDLMIFDPDEFFNRCLLVELKSKKGRMSQSQKNLARKVHVLEIRSLEDFVANVERFLNGTD